MALKPDMSNEYCDFSRIMENEKLILSSKQPLMFCSQGSSQNNFSNAIAQGSIKNNFSRNLNYPEDIFNKNYFHIKDVYMQEENLIEDGLEVLQILCSENVSSDEPEFIDVNELTGNETNLEVVQETNGISVSDDDDVVFVKEYRNLKEQNLKSPIQDIIQNRNLNNVRRNPIRSVRTKSRDLSKELLFEEDFAFLDVISEDEDEEETKIFKSSVESSSVVPKQWPINAHERPEYNYVTDKIDSFDYTIRDIQKMLPIRDNKLRKVTIRKQSKKKYSSKRRKPKSTLEKKYYLDELKPVVDSATEMLSQFLTNFKEGVKLCNFQTDLHNNKNQLKILKNQAVLFSLVHNIDHSEIMEKLRNMYVDNRNNE